MKGDTLRKRILVAPLHWGLGHATRCIPIIKALMTHNFEPVIASDGAALELLKKECPDLKAFELPSYNIKYPKNPRKTKLKFLKVVPHIFSTIKKEQQLISQIIKSENIAGIISDNRFGVRHPDITSVYITHQLNVLSGCTTWFTSRWHKRIIEKFDECWVPDFESKPNLSGNLGHPKKPLKNIKYIGPLSRFKQENVKRTIDVLIILSGPEPQRSYLQDQLLSEFQNKKESVVMVCGIVETTQTNKQINNVNVYNYMTSEQLQNAINNSKLILSRSGYTTIMDLAKLEKKAIFIPTPGQPEQQYLAHRLHAEKIVPSFSQKHFKYEDLNSINDFSGFATQKFDTNYEDLFRLF